MFRDSGLGFREEFMGSGFGLFVSSALRFPGNFRDLKFLVFSGFLSLWNSFWKTSILGASGFNV